MQVNKDEEREFLIKSAKKEKTYLKAMKELAKADNDCHAKLEIDGISHAFSTSRIFIPLIENEIKEINKAITGKPNKWE